MVVLREPFPRRERMPLVIGGLGLAIILWFEVQGQAQAGVLCGLVSGFTYAGVVLSLRALRSHDAVWLVAVAHLVTAVAMLPYVVYLDVWPSARQLPVLAAFGLFQMALPYVFFARGLRSITLARSHRHRPAGTAAAAAVGLPRLVRSARPLDPRRRRPDPRRPAPALRNRCQEPCSGAKEVPDTCYSGSGDQIAADAAHQVAHFQHADRREHLRRSATRWRPPPRRSWSARW